MENKCCSAKLVLFVALFIFVANEVEGRRNLLETTCRVRCPKYCVCKLDQCLCGEKQFSPAMISSDERKDDTCRVRCPKYCVCNG
ncbi:hypothetical protein LINPERPRIM_LOCUS11950, partial [Linum perenne]